MMLTRLLAATSAVAVGMTAPGIGAAGARGETAVPCTTVSTGANWQIRIDFDKATVDSNPARISDTQISWHDATDGGNYTLDRKSGNLTVIFASSTAGHFIYDRC